MSDDLKHERQQMLMARPWHVAEYGSIWLASGDYPKHQGRFTDCLVHVVYGGEDDQLPVFKFLGALALVDTDRVVTADQITRATRMVLVYAADPGTAYFVDEQPYLTGGAA